MSVSSKFILVSDPRVADVRHVGLRDAAFFLFICWFLGQDWHIVDCHKNGHWMDESTTAVMKTRSFTQSHKGNALDENISNRLASCLLVITACNPPEDRDSGVELHFINLIEMPTFEMPTLSLLHLSFTH